MNAADTIRAAIEGLEQQRVPGVEFAAALHRTIDAQLAILRNNIGGAEDIVLGHSPDEPASVYDALDLARAILGEEAE